MTDTKISALTDGGAVQATDDIPAVRAGANVRVQIPASSATPSDFQPAIVTGHYYVSRSIGKFSTTASYSTAGVANNIVAYPIWFSHTETWTRIGSLVDSPSVTPGAVIRFGIWENATGNVPGALVADSGALSLETSAEIEATISATLTANTLYWIGALANDGGASIPRGDASMFPFVAGSATSNGPYSNGYIKAQAYGALPNPFGTPDGEDGSTPGNVPAIWLRRV